MNNTRQLMLANHMYQGDNTDTFPMAMHGGYTPTGPNDPNRPWVTGWLDWDATANDDNTNIVNLINPQYAVLASYFANAKNVYKCPSDNFASPIQRRYGWDSRCRSVSGNIYVGKGNGWTSGPGYSQGGPANLGIYKGAAKAGDLTTPGPSQSWVYMDEHPDSINDAGAFAPDSQTNIPDAPATYHGGAAGFSFADGHSEIHKWRGATMTKTLKGISYNARNNFACSVGDPDVYWYSYATPRWTTRTVVP
jgi:prepilin-type processing-associated H-X9-DG protein